ncbi:MBL fold metallo-hydrolase [Roseateles chitinivorans]|uniref:MBL fold metallo-hydrolase n=1 Tax=Roseateles chitinivorans TaxID=2917965 RepID=UPI003D671DF6
MNINEQRRRLVGAMGLLGLSGCVAVPTSAGPALAPWQPGQLDIHHLAIGRGSATLVILPDGTSLLIDAGASANATDVSVATRPGPQRRAGEWIARYAQRHLAPTGGRGLDYLLVSHLHPDHLGDVAPGLPRSGRGDYLLTGVMDVAEQLDIGTLIDRGFPDYRYPGAGIERAPFAANYRAYVAARQAGGGAVQRFEAGTDRQFLPRGRRPVDGRFAVRNIAVNGEVWTGRGDERRSTFPDPATLPDRDRPSENMCCAAVRIESGPFRYFTGADLTSDTFNGDLPWRDILGAAARAAGPVDVATADHHGLYDGVSADVARTLRPSAWVIPTWHISHPSLQQLEHMFNERLYAGPREVFATEVMHENALMHRRLMQKLRSTRGHVIVRVEAGGERFRMLVTDNADESDRVIYESAPFRSGALKPA